MVLGLMLGFPFTNLCARNVQLVVPVMLLRRFFFFLGGGGFGAHVECRIVSLHTLNPKP